MSEDDKYLFDLNGYLVVRGVLTPEEVARASASIDRNSRRFVERLDPALRNAAHGTPFYGTGTGRKDMGRVLEWDGDDSLVFKSILAHEKLVPVLHGILGPGYRLDHLPLVIAQDGGAEGFQLHGGTVDCKTGRYNPELAYSCVHGTIRSNLLACSVVLTDHNAGDGGFCVVPGSHKSNFKMPAGMVDGERYSEHVVQPVTKAGDVVLFSEGTVHGARAWTPKDRQRRVCLYRFAPGTVAYGRSYFSSTGEEDGEGPRSVGWPSAMYKDLTDAQRAVLEPPYASRLDRPLIADAAYGTVKKSSRSQRKKDHDRQVFGTPYF
jgi:ectoine hydroxylase-related dioxygenase (phytanoyl-CoA dioxygenase family)